MSLNVYLQLSLFFVCFFNLYLCQRRWWRLCFHPFLSVCYLSIKIFFAKYVGLWHLFVTWFLATVFKQLFKKSFVCVGDQPRTATLNFCEDPNPNPDLRIFKVILHHWEIGRNRYIERYLKRLWMDSDETWWTGWVFDHNELIRFWWRSNENCLIF